MHFSTTKVWALFLAVPLFLLGCPDKPDARVVVSGDYSLDVGGTLALTADTVDGEDTGYTWTSSATTVATVDGSGVVTGVASGETTITATGRDSGAAGTHGIVVLPPPEVPAPRVVVTVPGYLIEVGGTVTATAATVDGDDASYTWTSSNEAVATVDAAGVVTGLTVGEAVITATGDDTDAAGAVGIVIVWAGGGIDPGEVPAQWQAWAGSAHADYTAEAFVHWNDDDPAEIPVSCARCHSTTGYRDYLGDDGSAVGVVDTAAPVGEVVTCNACHSSAAQALTDVTFPSGVTLTDLGAQARCQVCHQGRESTDSVDTLIGAIGDDSLDASLRFLNIHYFAAGATRNGGWVRGGYQYAGQHYDGQFQHAAGLGDCNDCHNAHSLEVKVSACSTCHTGVTDVASLRDIRMIASSMHDYDGDGNLTEGIYYEVAGLRDVLLTALQSYADAAAERDAICYSGSAYPYYFVDTDGDGACGAAEANFGNRYTTWTPRLLRAAYNYQYAAKDPGGFAHNAKYVIQLLFDSLDDLASAPATASREESGHFEGSAEAFRHWDGDPEVSARCSKCHGGQEGLHFYLTYGTTTTVDPITLNGLQCETCHSDLATAALVAVSEVTLPSGITVDDFDPGGPGMLCATCHSGRESGATIDAAIAAGNLSFRNVHYLSAAGTLLGTDGQVGYEYAGKTYATRFTHTPGNGCNVCHSGVNTGHTFRPEDNLAACTGCHVGAGAVEDIRLTSTLDYDGDGSTAEPLAGELQDLGAALYVEIQAAATGGGNPICYNGNAYPYWFNEAGGVCTASFGNRYQSWTPAMIRAAHNYQIFQKEGGAWAHNFAYAAQLLIDSVEDLGGNVGGFVRP